MGVEIRLDLTGAMAEHVLGETGEHGTYADPVEYVRDLIRRDMGWLSNRDEALRARLQAAFAEPESAMVELDAATFIEEMRAERR